jgi:hypothetical protein
MCLLFHRFVQIEGSELSFWGNTNSSVETFIPPPPETKNNNICELTDGDAEAAMINTLINFPLQYYNNEGPIGDPNFTPLTVEQGESKGLRGATQIF